VRLTQPITAPNGGSVRTAPDEIQLRSVGSMNRVVQCSVVTLPGLNVSAVSVTVAFHCAF
jgi:hypothetical protein